MAENLIFLISRGVQLQNWGGGAQPKLADMYVS